MWQKKIKQRSRLSRARDVYSPPTWLDVKSPAWLLNVSPHSPSTRDRRVSIFLCVTWQIYYKAESERCKECQEHFGLVSPPLVPTGCAYF